MSPTSQSRQTSYSTARADHREPTGNIATTYNSNNSAGKLSSTTNIASDSMQRPPPRLSSAYRRTLETHRGSQSGSINLDTFDVPCPPSAPFPSPRALRFPGPDGFTMTASETEKDGNGGAHGRRKSGCGASAFPSTSSSSSAVGNVPDLGEVDLSDGKNKERPQRFKAVIHFKRRETDPSTRLRQGGGSSRPPRSGEEKYGDPL
ncbi:hypothetical protein M407DRAFT_243119 [Tulasnella calospora MUT 4182]|uniref:Uncharacterized protein n=1 Tax=Tulasnella calospora MUT 4182 TaxID=1051891 RepID=A0A0C3QKZ0_9AGAM|nr:hypothetical protein M407DRAFT_243119 [Tulasnella calospora MUT 4182]